MRCVACAQYLISAAWKQCRVVHIMCNALGGRRTHAATAYHLLSRLTRLSVWFLMSRVMSWCLAIDAHYSASAGVCVSQLIVHSLHCFVHTWLWVKHDEPLTHTHATQTHTHTPLHGVADVWQWQDTWFPCFQLFHDTSVFPIPNCDSSRRTQTNETGKNEKNYWKMCICNVFTTNKSGHVNVGRTSHWTWNNLFEKETQKFIFSNQTVFVFRIWQWCSALSVCDCARSVKCGTGTI